MTQILSQKIYVRILTWLGLAVDISSKDSGPETVKI